jgi:flagellar biosynthesis/type III secretory pathway chaperone
MTPLGAVLSELHSVLSRFVELLEQESDCLKDIDAENLSSVVAEKTRQAELCNVAWNRLVAASGISDNRGDKLETALSALPEVQDRWQAVRRLVQEAARLNHSNSLLIEAQMRRTRQALDVLQIAANRGTLYGSDGMIVDNLQHLHSLNKV